MDLINADLQNERQKCTFDIKELTNVIDGGPEKTVERKIREKYMLEDKEVFDSLPEEYQSQQERYEGVVKRSCYIFNSIRRWQKEERQSVHNYRQVISGILNSSLVRDGSILGLHYIMFIPAIINLGDEEQHERWLKRAWDFSIVGSFAQSELGHGSFVRGLETTATYDPETKEFVLNTPTLTSRKWWAGGLGHTANYCIVVAQLYTLGECRGVHAFMVQVRDESSHRVLPGVTVGDVGAKLGLNAVNNGFMVLDHVRIPRKNMLMKHAQVLEDGTYVQSRNSKLTYGPMVFVRVLIVFDMVNYLSRTVTIATRYSAVRRQCQLKENAPEVQILDYMTQQHKIFVGIASCHAFRINANKLWDTFNDVMDELKQGDMKRLAEIHSLACCLKAITTSDCASMIERCRLACGGHGYMTSSNLPFTYGVVTAACTYEGDNTVLLLQTARFLMKCWQQMNEPYLPSTVAYLKRSNDHSFKNRSLKDVDNLVRAFEIVATRKISCCVEIMERRMKEGASIDEAWNMTSVQLVSAAEAHCRAVIISTYVEETSKLQRSVSPSLYEVLWQMVELYTIYWALQIMADILRHTEVSNKEVEVLQQWYEELLTKIRPNAVGLIDAFDIRDEMLQSTLGAYDGRVYERLMEEALKSPLNAEPVNKSFHTHLKPFMQGKL